MRLTWQTPWRRKRDQELFRRTYGGKVAVITGAGSGMGRWLAILIARAGGRLAISDVNLEGLKETAERCRREGIAEGDLHVYRLDVSELAAFELYAEEVVEKFGVVHAVFNNAGIAHTGSLEEVSVKEIERVIDIDFWGVVYGSKVFLPALIASGDGKLVNVASLFSYVAVPTQNAYNAAKFAVRGFTESVAMEMLIHKRPVTVHAICPGGIRTAVARSAGVAEGRNSQDFAKFFDRWLAWTYADSAAAIILRRVAKKRSRMMVGYDAEPLALLSRVFPSAYKRLVVLTFGWKLRNRELVSARK